MIENFEARIFSSRDFCTITALLFNPISKMFCYFLLKLNMAKRRDGFSALWAVMPRKKNKLAKNKIRFDLQLSNGDSGARTVGLEIFDNSFYFKNPCIA